MKPKDLGLILGSIILGAIVSIVASKYIFSSSSNGQQVDVVPIISSNLTNPDAKYFNTNSIDPTTFINIGNSNNPNPFINISNSPTGP
jgi:hypothetical protein